jgi:TonB family protein
MQTFPGMSRVRSNEARLALFILLSILLHGMLMYAIPSLFGSALNDEKELKKPIWVDLVDFNDPASAEKPAAMAPVVKPVSPPPKAAVAKKKVPKKKVRPRKKARTVRAVTPDPSAAVPEEPRDIPPVKDLIPSMQNLMAMQQSPNDPFRALQVGPQQNGMGRSPADTMFEKYLLELKRKVERHWKVSLNLGIREGTTVIYVIVADDGSLFSCDILKPSGMIAHDYEAMEAVKKAFPLSPPPKTLLNEKGILPIRFSFHYLVTPPS